MILTSLANKLIEFPLDAHNLSQGARKEIMES